MKQIVMLICCLSFMNTIHAEDLEIKGNDVIEIAMQGESITQYHVPNNYTLSLSTPYPNVMLDENGVLHVNQNVEEGMITLKATFEGHELTKDIKLIESWTKQVEGASEYQIVSPDETRKIDYMERVYEVLPVHIVRIFISSSIAFIYVMYLVIRRKG